MPTASERSIIDSVHPLIRGYVGRADRVSSNLSELNEIHADHKRTIPFENLPPHLAAAVDLAHLHQPDPDLAVTCTVDLEYGEIRASGYPEKVFRGFVVSWDTADDFAIARLWIGNHYSQNLEDDDRDWRRFRTVRTRQALPAISDKYMARAILLTDHLTNPVHFYYRVAVLEELLRATNPAFPIDQLRPDKIQVGISGASIALS